MKISIQFLCFFIVGFTTLNSLAQSDKVYTTSVINEVIVFDQGAQVARSAKVLVPKGISTILLKGLTEYVNPSSIQAKIQGATILGASFRRDYITDEETNLDRKKLEAAIEELEFDLATLNNKRLNINQELKLIEDNNLIKGEEVLDVADVEDFLIFYKTNLPMIRKSLLATEIKSKKGKEKLLNLQTELKALKGSDKKVSGVIEIEVSTNKAETKNLSVNYLVRKAWWEPLYNVRAAGLDKTISLEFIANVHQQTGVDWKNIQLTLATGSPQMDGNAPVLNPWYLEYKERRQRSGNRYKLRGVKGRSDKSKKEMVGLVYSTAENASVAQESNNITFREYRINLPYNISSTGKKQRIEITKQDLPAEFEYYCVPKRNTRAYLLAKVPDWEQYNLLSGQSKIYFEDTYVGEAFIDAQNTEDTLSLSLGVDKGIVIERKQVLDKSRKAFIGGKQTTKKINEITIRNTKNTSVTIEIVDQIPVSKQNEIKVKLQESSDAILNPLTGELKWKVKLGPGETVVKRFEFEVLFPKNKKIDL